MIIDERSYTLQSGRVADYLELFEREVLPLQSSALGALLGLFHTETGTLNQVVYLWAYESMAERERRRALLAKHPDWKRTADQLRPMIVAQSNRILVAHQINPLPTWLRAAPAP
jgi:hypothetical protein